jgi:hypothetical protein
MADASGVDATKTAVKQTLFMGGVMSSHEQLPVISADGGGKAKNDTYTRYKRGTGFPSGSKGSDQSQTSRKIEVVSDENSSETIGQGLFKAASWMSGDSVQGRLQMQR